MNKMNLPKIKIIIKKMKVIQILTILKKAIIK